MHVPGLHHTAQVTDTELVNADMIFHQCHYSRRPSGHEMSLQQHLYRTLPFTHHSQYRPEGPNTSQCVNVDLCHFTVNSFSWRRLFCALVFGKTSVSDPTVLYRSMIWSVMLDKCSLVQHQSGWSRLYTLTLHTVVNKRYIWGQKDFWETVMTVTAL